MPMEYQHVTVTPQPDKVAEVRDLLDQVAALVTAKKAENGPMSWCATVSDDGKQFFVEALFENQEAIEFHQANIGDVFVKFFDLIAEPPETTILSVVAAS